MVAGEEIDFDASMFTNETYVSSSVTVRGNGSLSRLQRNTGPFDVRWHWVCRYGERTFRVGEHSLRLLCSPAASSKQSIR